MDKKTLTAKLGVDGLCKGASTGIKWFASEKTKNSSAIRRSTTSRWEVFSAPTPAIMKES